MSCWKIPYNSGWQISTARLRRNKSYFPKQSSPFWRKHLLIITRKKKIEVLVYVVKLEKTSSILQWHRAIIKSIILENNFILVLSALVLWRQTNASERRFVIRQGRRDTGLPSHAISEAETLTMALKVYSIKCKFRQIS